MARFLGKIWQKVYVIIFTQGNPDEDRFKGFFADTAEVFDYLGFNIEDILITCGNLERGEVKNREDVLKEAGALGARLAKK